MKKALLIFLLFSSVIVGAQKKQNIYYLKNSGKEVFVPDSADFIRVVQEPDSGEVQFNLLEYYRDGKKKLVGKVSSFSPRIIYEGVITIFAKNGTRKSAITYRKNEAVGPAYYFFESGKLNKQIENLPKNEANKYLSLPFKMVSLADSLGNILVQDGNGRAIETTTTKGDEFIEEGLYKDGFKDGKWIGRYRSGKSNYEEEYSMGKFVRGMNTIGNEKLEYLALETKPDFKGGIQQFYRYLSQSIRYPQDAAERGISGSVIVSFTIEKDGQVTGAVIMKSLSPSTDQEALRVILASPKWIPGIQRGVPVRVKYNIPISFKMR